MGLKIIETKKLLSDTPTDNHFFEKNLDTNDKWIRERTGVVTRYFDKDKSLRDRIYECGLKFENTDNIKAVFVASLDKSQVMPSYSSGLQKVMGLRQDIFTADINMACSGFVGAVILAHGLLKNKERVLIIGAERLSSIVDFSDRSTCILFGDGIGAAIFEKTEDDFFFDVGCRSQAEDLFINDKGYVQMNGKSVFRFAHTEIPRSISRLMEKSKVDPDLILLHQANSRIIESIRKVLKKDEDTIPQNIDKYANTSSASIGILLDELELKDKNIILSGFGAGLNWASCLVRGGENVK